MLTIKTSGGAGQYKLDLPTSINEITEEYIKDVTEHVNIAPHYTIVGLIYREKLSTLAMSARKKAPKDIAVIPIFVKAGPSDSEFINSLHCKDKLIIGSSDLMMGYHISAPNNLLTLDTFSNLISGDLNFYNEAINNKEYCHFIEFKLIPNCNIHGAYNQPKVAEFVNPYITKISDTPKSNLIVGV